MNSYYGYDYGDYRTDSKANDFGTSYEDYKKKSPAGSGWQKVPTSGESENKRILAELKVEKERVKLLLLQQKEAEEDTENFMTRLGLK